MIDFKPHDIFECIHIDITDDMLKQAKIAAWMFNQQLCTPEGKQEPYEPKKFPEKAIDIMIPLSPLDNNDTSNNKIIEIYLDADSKLWNSRFVIDGRFGKLSPDQMQQFFKSEFYQKLTDTIANKWPLSDDKYSALYYSILTKGLDIGMSQSDLEEYNKCQQTLNEVDQARKRKDLANQDISGDGKRDYSGSGRKIIHFGDMGVKNSSGKFFCWPRRGKEFKWNSWCDWTKIKPFARMTFVHNGRRYMISVSLSDEDLDNRGFKGADLSWTPPLAWLTPDECQEVMSLSLVNKFLSRCVERTKPFLEMSSQEIYERIDRRDKVTIKQIEKTQRVIKRIISTVFRKQQADTYKYET